LIVPEKTDTEILTRGFLELKKMKKYGFLTKILFQEFDLSLKRGKISTCHMHLSLL